MKTAPTAGLPREYCLAERQEAIELLRALDDETGAMLDAARRRRRVLIRRVHRYERLAGAAGGVNRAFDDASPWWAGDQPATADRHVMVNKWREKA